MNIEKKKLFDPVYQEIELKSRKMAREIRCLCPECKTVVNDQIVKNLAAAELSGTDLLGQCPACLASFTLRATIKCRKTSRVDY